MKTLAACILLSAAVLGTAAAAENAPKADPKGAFGAFQPSRAWTPPKDPKALAKLAEWQDLKLGVLISWQPSVQWGLDSWPLVTTRHTWNQRMNWPAGKPAPGADNDRAFQQAYERLPLTFNPVKFDAGKWAAALKAGGVRYALAMTKHHDGFCLWDTKTTEYRITSPQYPFYADPRADTVKQICDALRKQGLWAGVYFSKADWNSPRYWLPELGPGANQGPNYNPAKQPEKWKNFKEFTWAQIAEIMTGYGKLDILWLDGGAVNARSGAGIDMAGMAAMARGYQPGLIVVDRCCGGGYEDYITPEGDHQMPQAFLPHPWEVCQTMGGHWNWFPDDSKFKSAATIIRNLCLVTARNGNYLLGIGPDANGEFAPAVYERLAELGRWLQVNGEAVYATRPLPPYEAGDCVFTQRRDGSRYAIILPRTPDGGLPESVTVPAGLAANAVHVSLLGYGPLEPAVVKDGQAVIAIPAAARAKPPCKYAWALKFAPPAPTATTGGRTP